MAPPDLQDPGGNAAGNANNAGNAGNVQGAGNVAAAVRPIDKKPYECFSLISRPSPVQLDGQRIAFMK